MAVVICGCGGSLTACTNPVATYVGSVLHTYERNGWDDSDWFAIVWDAESGTIRHVGYASTSSWTYHNGADVDATPEVLALAEQALLVKLTEQARVDATKPAVRRRVRSLTTRGKNVGVEGVVRWMGEQRSRYGSWSYGERVGVKVEGEEKLRYLDADRVEVLDPPAVDEVAVARVAARREWWRLI